MNWDNRFYNHFSLPKEHFLTAVGPAKLNDATLIGWSAPCAEMLGVDLNSFDWLAMTSGHSLPAGTAPCATVYSGHQFGVWAGQLGDGRACLLGELVTDRGSFELQIKGSGKTPYSRGGDGMAVVRSSIREFLCSEAMAGLGIPTTRALCIAQGSNAVMRETVESAATVLRVAPSFIRFGHFEHFAAKGDVDSVRTLADFVCQHFYPTAFAVAPSGDERRYIALLEAVVHATATLMAHWQGVGFCHGVMNTDNMSILGLTIDYGPFGFMDTFDAWHVCNHSDTQGRYAYARQPQVAHWNLACLAQALSVLVADHDALVTAIDRYTDTFNTLHQNVFLNKLGLSTALAQGGLYVSNTLQCLHEAKADMTLFFRHLSHAVYSGNFGKVRDVCVDAGKFDAWLVDYKQWLALDPCESQARSTRMLACNPKYVLRNHLAETAIRGVCDQNDTAVLDQLLKVLATPYDEHVEHEAFAAMPPVWAASLSVSCSS